MTSPADTPAPPVSGTKSLVGEVLSERYRVEALVGEGGMGAVYLAEHILMRKRVAVKVLHPEMTRMPEIVARFEREAMAAAHIEHPNVAAATDFGKLNDGAFFLVLEYVEGRSLRELIGEGPMPVELALHIAEQMAAALGGAHALGIVHRDLKPENVMLVLRDGDKHFVKVLDFGVAKVPVGELSRGIDGTQIKAPLTQLGMVYGTPEYMAPEQALGQEVDARADLYALGVILFEMLTGVRPFEAQSKVTLLGMKVTSDPPSMRSKNPDVRVDDSIELLVHRLLHREAAARFQEARDVTYAIDLCRMGEADTSPPRSRLRSPRVNSPTIRAADSPEALASPLREAALGEGPEGARVAPSLEEKSVGGANDRWSRAWFSALTGRSRAWFSALTGRLPAVVRDVPPLGIIGTGGLVLLVALLLGIAKVRDSPRSLERAASSAASGVSPAVAAESAGPSAGTDPPPAQKSFISELFETARPATATPDELASAARGGASSLEELAARYPKDPTIFRALLRAYMREKRGVDGMRVVSKLFGLSESAADEQEIRDAVRTAAQGSAESVDAAFTLMEGGVGFRGADWLYDLATSTKASSRTIARAKQALGRGSVRARMSKALAVAWDLRSAGGCEAKKALLPRARQYGDSRALTGLRPLQATKGCGFLNLGDCWSCLHRDGGLAAAIAAIEQRGK